MRPNRCRVIELNRTELFYSHGGTRPGQMLYFSLIYSADPQSHMTPSVSDTSLDNGHMSREAPGSSLMDTFLALDTLVEKRGPGRRH